jgi:hypothetical protein
VYKKLMDERLKRRNGEKLGKDVEKNDRRMKEKRCGYMCEVDIEKKMKEEWMDMCKIIKI